MTPSLAAFFDPRSIAVIGASRNPSKVGGTGSFDPGSRGARGSHRMVPLLHGVRGEPGVDLAALARTISRFSYLAAELEAIVEIELNPLIARPDGVVAVDARAALTAGG